MRAGAAIAMTAVGASRGGAATREPAPAAATWRPLYVEIDSDFVETTAFDGVSEIGGYAFQHIWVGDTPASEGMQVYLPAGEMRWTRYRGCQWFATNRLVQHPKFSARNWRLAQRLYGSPVRRLFA